jgi:hypothetical protein
MTRRHWICCLRRKVLINSLPDLVEQQVRLFHKWLRQCRDRGVNLKKVDLSQFDDFTMASLLDSKEAESSVHGRPGPPKDSGLVLPIFGGGQGAFKVFDTKFHVFLCQNKNEEGKPLIYVIANYKKESKTIQRQIKGLNRAARNLIMIISRWLSGLSRPWWMEPLWLMPKLIVVMAVDQIKTLKLRRSV